jgi:glutamate dehydrogenase/leucine dehydrogenase
LQKITFVVLNAEVLDASSKEKTDMRNAAYRLAIIRISNAMQLRGIFP